MKIALINTLYAPYKIGGAEVSVQLLAESLQRAGHEVGVFCLHELDEVKYDTLNGVHIAYLPLKNVYWPFKASAASKLKKRCGTYSILIIHLWLEPCATSYASFLRMWCIPTTSAGFPLLRGEWPRSWGRAWCIRLAIIIYSTPMARCLNMAKIWMYSRLQCASPLI